MSRTNVAPPPTREEVLAVFSGGDEDRVYTAGDVAAKIYWNRGGIGNPKDVGPLLREVARVLPIGSGRVKKLLIDMVEDGTLLSETGYRANRLGRVWGNLRKDTQYFALRTSAEAAISLREVAAQRAEQMREFAITLENILSGQVTAVRPENDHIAVILSVEQAHAMFNLSSTVAPSLVGPV